MNSRDIRVIALDLDGTLTQHRTPLPAESRELLDRLGRRYRLLMVGAGQCRRIYSMEANWDAIRAQLETLPSAATLTDLLREIGCPCTPEEIGLDECDLRDTFLYCKEVRARYTILQLVYDLGLMEKLSQRVIARAFS